MRQAHTHRPAVRPGVLYTVCGEPGMVYDGREDQWHPDPRYGRLHRFRSLTTGSMVAMPERQVRWLVAEGRISEDGRPRGPGRAA